VETPIRELLTALCEVAAFRGDWIHEPRRTADVDHHIGDASRFVEITGFRNRTSLREGLARTWEWYRSQRSTARA
jgi:nucleoside-diphosphate-sugar epimerase